jgi:hypothetical protein
VNALARVGLDVAGAPYVDDLDKTAWSELGALLCDEAKPADLWIIAGRTADFDTMSVRYGLSLAAAMALGRDGGPPAMAVLHLDGDGSGPDLPTLLRRAQRLDGRASTWAAKVVAMAHRTPAAPPVDFHINVIGHPMIGTWVEVGPTDGATWQGALMGVSGDAEVLHQAVGPRGQLPERTTLNYPSTGIKAEAAGEAFTASSVQNPIGPGESYYAKITGHPSKLIVGSDVGADAPEVSVVTLA